MSAIEDAWSEQYEELERRVESIKTKEQYIALREELINRWDWDAHTKYHIEQLFETIYTEEYCISR